MRSIKENIKKKKNLNVLFYIDEAILQYKFLVVSKILQQPYLLNQLNIMKHGTQVPEFVIIMFQSKG